MVFMLWESLEKLLFRDAAVAEYTVKKQHQITANLTPYPYVEHFHNILHGNLPQGCAGIPPQCSILWILQAS